MQNDILRLWHKKKNNDCYYKATEPVSESELEASVEDANRKTLWGLKNQANARIKRNYCIAPPYPPSDEEIEP